MDKLNEYYNNQIPESFIQKLLNEQAMIIQRIKSGEDLTEDKYIQEFIRENSQLTVIEMNLWREIIEEAFHYGVFYYKTQEKHNEFINNK